MTEKQKRLLAYIRDYIDRAGIAPSLEQMAAKMGTESKSSAHRMVASLIKTGHLVRVHGVGARNIRLPGVDLSSVPTPALAAELERRRNG